MVAVIAIVAFVSGRAVANPAPTLLGVQATPTQPQLPQFVQDGGTFANWKQFSDQIGMAGIDLNAVESKIQDVRSCAEANLGPIVSSALPDNISGIQSNLGQNLTSKVIAIEARQAAEQCIRQQLPPEIISIIGNGPLSAEIRTIGNKIRSCASKCMTSLKGQANQRIGGFQNLDPSQIEAELRNQIQSCIETTCADVSIPSGFLNKVESVVDNWKRRNESESAAPQIQQGQLPTSESLQQQLPTSEGLLQKIFGGLGGFKPF